MDQLCIIFTHLLDNLISEKVLESKSKNELITKMKTLDLMYSLMSKKTQK